MAHDVGDAAGALSIARDALELLHQHGSVPGLTLRPRLLQGDGARVSPMIEALASWTIGALLGTVLRRATRARRRREGARARQRRAVRALLDELSAFAAGLELDIEHSATIRIANPEAVEVTWREHRDVLAGLPARDLNVIERAVATVGSGKLEETRAEILAAIDVLRGQLE